MTALVPVAFWLLPAPPDASWLQNHLQALATRHGGPAFEPHVTLHVGTRPAGLAVEPILATVARQAGVLELECLETAHSAAYYKALFAPLVEAPAPAGAGLPALRARLLDALARAGAPDSDYVLAPHLSLLYGTFDAALRHDLAGSQSLLGRRIRFDRIAAVRPAPGSVDLARVADWEVFGHCRLAVPPNANP